MEFTSAVAAQTALQLAAGKGRPGAHTPAAALGPDLATAAGADFVDDALAWPSPLRRTLCSRLPPVFEWGSNTEARTAAKFAGDLCARSVRDTLFRQTCLE